MPTTLAASTTAFLIAVIAWHWRSLCRRGETLCPICGGKRPRLPCGPYRCRYCARMFHVDRLGRGHRSKTFLGGAWVLPALGALALVYLASSVCLALADCGQAARSACAVLLSIAAVTCGGGLAWRRGSARAGVGR